MSLSLKMIRAYVLGTAIAVFYWLYSRLWRVKEVDYPKVLDPRLPKLYAHWHGDELLLIRMCIFKRMAIMASRSKDGELMRVVLQAFGFKVVRGSSTRGGGAGLKGLIDAVRREGYHTSLAVDGPHGPIFKVKPGIIKLAQETGLPIVPGAGASGFRFVFKKAWNRCYLPLPFSSCVVLYGEPLVVPKELSEEKAEELREELERRLLQLKVRAEKHFERVPDLLPSIQGI